MRIEWSLIFALLFALIIAIFSVLNVESVEVNFLIAQSDIPLILIILGAALAGGVIVGAVSIYRQYTIRRELKLIKQAVRKNFGEAALDEIESLLQKKKASNNEDGNDQQASEGEIPIEDKMK